MYQDRQKKRVRCLKHASYLAAGFLKAHHKNQNGVGRGDQGETIPTPQQKKPNFNWSTFRGWWRWSHSQWKGSGADGECDQTQDPLFAPPHAVYYSDTGGGVPPLNLMSQMWHVFPVRSAKRASPHHILLQEKLGEVAPALGGWRGVGKGWYGIQGPRAPYWNVIIFQISQEGALSLWWRLSNSIVKYWEGTEELGTSILDFWVGGNGWQDDGYLL